MKKSTLNSVPQFLVPILFALVTLIAAMPVPVDAAAVDCNVSERPLFLDSASAVPNLLMIIDNSSSMYDIGYNEGYTGPEATSYNCADNSICTKGSDDCVSLCWVSLCKDEKTPCTYTDGAEDAQECIDECQGVTVGTCANAQETECSSEEDCRVACTTKKCTDGVTQCNDSLDCEANCLQGYQCSNNSNPCTVSTVDSDCGVIDGCKVTGGNCSNDNQCGMCSTSHTACNNDNGCPDGETCSSVGNECGNINTCDLVNLCGTDMSCTPVGAEGDLCKDENGVPNYTCTGLESGSDPCGGYYTCSAPVDNCGGDYECRGEPTTLANVDCIDNAYDSSKDYMGYFRRLEDDTVAFNTSSNPRYWYSYNTTNNRFEPTTTPSCSDSTWYSTSELCVAFNSDVSPRVTAFKATGNFLNWATSSKFDIEKKILTGGKYSSGVLESEGRGCSGQSFIKEVMLSSGKYLRMGIRGSYNPDENTTLIDIYPVGSTSISPPTPTSTCQAAFGSMDSLGDAHKIAKACFGQTSGDVNSLLNHSMQDCWSLRTGKGNPNNFHKYLKDCKKKVYSGTSYPKDIQPSSPVYICYGDGSTTVEEGFIGECFNSDGTSEKTSSELLNVGAGYSSIDACEEAAVRRFCRYLNLDDPVDPTGNTVFTGSTWNLPLMTQWGNPTTFYVNIQQTTAPTGLLQQYADKIYIGAMAFNNDGAATECADIQTSMPNYTCVDSKDGSYLVQPIGAVNSNLVNNVNIISAKDRWTPLAESMFNAIGYYTQRTDFRINVSDFNISSANVPISDPCSKNFVLLITDGGSTADQNAIMETKVTSMRTAGEDDGDTDTTNCTGNSYEGSTYLDDLTYYAKHGTDLFTSTSGLSVSQETITTLVVANGQPVGTDSECDAKKLLQDAAANAGTTYIEAQSPTLLYAALESALSSIVSNTGSGSAASVVSASRNGEGAVYQAVFWPGLVDPNNNNPADDSTNGITRPSATVWVGDVHAMMVDNSGTMYEDTFEDGQLTTVDKTIVLFFYDYTKDPTYQNSPDTFPDYQKVKETRACRDGLVVSTGTGETATIQCSNTDEPDGISLHRVKYLWSAAEWLSGILDTDILSNRSSYISDTKKRFVFTWKGDGYGIIDFDNTNATDLKEFLMVADSDAADSDAETALINWVRGKDKDNDSSTLPDNAFRTRQVLKPDNFNDSISESSADTDTSHINDIITWRLGDVVHSTPTAVGKPIENYHMLYRDSSYNIFVQHYLNRRQVVYFGGNDGMLHAVNSGFFKNTDGTMKFCRDLNCSSTTGTPELGAELWAYIPYNLLPHLSCLTASDYGTRHKYYMDAKPRIFDVRIFAPNTDDDTSDTHYHPGGWGTILVAGMGYGGSPVDDGTNYYISSYIIMDITDPEKKPVLLGELTDNGVDMGYTTGMPAVVPMKSITGSVEAMKWYLVLGSGPTASDGTSSQKPKIALFPLDKLTASSPGDFQIANAAPTDTSGGMYELNPGGSGEFGFVSDIITVDYDLETDYRADAIYFGTVEGTSANTSAGGKLYRWATLSDSAITTPAQWSKPAVMFDPERPITAGPNVGYDGRNFWLYFGTGRFLEFDDKINDDQDYYYGLKEPMDCDENFLFKTDSVVSDEWVKSKIANVPNLNNYPADATLPGNRHLLRVDNINVLPGETANVAKLTSSATLPNLPDFCFAPNSTGQPIEYFSQLKDYIVGGCCKDASGTVSYEGTDGWYRKLPLGERNLGQATVFGGLLTFTGYNPSACDSGESFLYSLYYQTGTSWYQDVYGDGDGTSTEPIVYKKTLGIGLAITPNLHVGTGDGASPGAKVFVQTSTGEIVEILQPNLSEESLKTGRSSWKSD